VIYSRAEAFASALRISTEMSAEQDSSAGVYFARIAAHRDAQIRLAEAALFFAADEYPSLDVSHYIGILDQFGERARQRLAETSGPRRAIDAVNTTLFEDLGFRGNRRNYYDPRNSYLNEVIDRRVGIPITLTVVYMEVARRVGLEVNGVGMPGHFIAKHSAESGDIFIDAFNEGRIIGQSECNQLFKSTTGSTTDLEPRLLQSATNRQILTRLLSNLLGIYSRINRTKAIRVIELMTILNPGNAAYIRDRGLLLAELGGTGKALANLEQYLQLQPKAVDAPFIREQIKALRQLQARLN